MTVRIYPAPLAHPSECEVCGGARRVSARSVRRWKTLKPQGLTEVQAAKFAVLIACPQCAGAHGLLRLLPIQPNPEGGAA